MYRIVKPFLHGSLLVGTFAATFALGVGGCGSNTSALVCPSGSTDCGGVCVNTSSDAANCGSCGNTCDPGLACTDGACVGDVDAPTVTATTPADGDQTVAADITAVTITFNEPINAAALTADSVVISGADGAHASTLYLAPGGTELYCLLDEPLGHLISFDVTVDGGIEDLAGNAMGSDYTISFTTAPVAVLISPPEFYGHVGDTTTMTLSAIGDLGSETVENPSWSSGDEQIATVDADGLVELAGDGITEITASALGVQATAPVAAASAIGSGTGYLATHAVWAADSGGESKNQLHTWDLDCDGVVTDGGYDQYDDIWEIDIENTTTSDSGSFPCAGSSEVSFDPPYAFHDSISLETDAEWDGFHSDGSSACHVRPIGQASMWQEVSLPAGATSLMLQWDGHVDVEQSFGEDARARVVLEDMTGGTGETVLWSESNAGWVVTSGRWTTQTADLLPWAGQTVRIRFEVLGGGYEDWGGGFILDRMSLVDDQWTDYLVNGGCETDLTGWHGDTYLIPREVNIEPTDPVAGVKVRRSIYAPYDDGYWIRYLDTFTNTSDSEVTISVEYVGDLGSDGSGAVYTADDGRAVLEYDTTSPVDGSDPALGTLPGTYASMDAPPFDAAWTFDYDLTIGPGKSKSILAFHLFGDDNFTHANAFLEALATEILTSVDSKGVGSPYLVGVSPDEWATVSNWP